MPAPSLCIEKGVSALAFALQYLYKPISEKVVYCEAVSLDNRAVNSSVWLYL